MTTIYFDIETIGSTDPAVIADIAAGISCPGNISKAESIAAWEKDKKPAAVDEAVKKTSFDGGLGRIICIGWAVNDGIPLTSIGDDEGALIAAFFDAVQQAAQVHYRTGKSDSKPIFVGHNIGGFDLRFLWQRAVVHGIKPPQAIPFKAKPWDGSIGDTMLLWNPERERRTSLDKLCKVLGVPTPKGDLDGSKVWDYYKAGRILEIAEYCKGDVKAVRQCYRKMMFAEPDLLAAVA